MFVTFIWEIIQFDKYLPNGLKPPTRLWMLTFIYCARLLIVEMFLLVLIDLCFEPRCFKEVSI